MSKDQKMSVTKCVYLRSDLSKVSIGFWDNSNSEIYNNSIKLMDHPHSKNHVYILYNDKIYLRSLCNNLLYSTTTE